MQTLWEVERLIQRRPGVATDVASAPDYLVKWVGQSSRRNEWVNVLDVGKAAVVSSDWAEDAEKFLGVDLNDEDGLGGASKKRKRGNPSKKSKSKRARGGRPWRHVIGGFGGL
jgi:hypothetical protein